MAGLLAVGLTWSTAATLLDERAPIHRPAPVGYGAPPDAGGGWVAAGDLRPGDWVVDSSGRRLVVESVAVEQRRAEHFNFEVEGWHTYFVSETAHDPAIWVHNKCPAQGEELGDGGSGTVYRNRDEPGLTVKKYHDHVDPNTAALEHQNLQRAKRVIGDEHVVTSRAPTEPSFLVREEVTPRPIPPRAADGWERLAARIRADDPSARDWGRVNWLYGTTPGNSRRRWILIDDPY